MADKATMIQDAAENAWQAILRWATSPEFYAQVGLIVLALVVAFVTAALVRRSVPLLSREPESGRFLLARLQLYRLRVFVFPLLNILFLEIAATAAQQPLGQDWLIRMAQSAAVVFLIITFATRFIQSRGVRGILLWVGIPVATMQLFGVLESVVAFLDGISLSAGDIRVSLYALLRTVIFGGVLFWLGRRSNTAGKKAIRNQKSWDVGTREVFAKLFEIGLFIVIALLLLQIMGINLTALAVFGGALGVGLGFGLQQIASNFVSGIIILLDRSVSIGDFLELEDGRRGVLSELNMRFGVLETYDGKYIMVPNEQFITTSYTNWTHKNPKQRYPLEFQVAYSTDLDLLFDNIRQICAEHPKVLSGDDIPIEERPDAEIAGFGDNGIDILVEFWMEGIDDGPNRVGADLLHAIWRSIQENGMEIPFPQREVRILNDNTTFTISANKPTPSNG